MQEHLEVCESTQHLKVKLDMSKNKERMIFWRKISNKLDKQYKEAKLNKPSDQPIVKKNLKNWGEQCQAQLKLKIVLLDRNSQ